VTASSRYDDEVFIDARDWLRGLISGQAETGESESS
jgi:prephenate dehydratase